MELLTNTISEQSTENSQTDFHEWFVTQIPESLQQLTMSQPDKKSHHNTHKSYGQELVD
jgi:hypothetical protein